MLLIVSAGFTAMGFMIAFRPATYLRSCNAAAKPWATTWLVGRKDLETFSSWRSRTVGVFFILFGIIFAVLSVYVSWFQ